MRSLIQLLTVLAIVAALASCKAIDGPSVSTDGQEATSTTADDTPANGEAPAAADNPTGIGAADGGEADAAADAAAVVNGIVIGMDEFRAVAMDTQRVYVERGLDPNSAEGQQELLRLRRQVLDDMINLTLIEASAAEMGITVDDSEVEAAIEVSIAALGGREQFEQALAEHGTSMADVRAMERAGILGLKVQEKITADLPDTAGAVHARHILCETEAACQAALARLRAGEDFGAVAAEVSTDKATAERAGDLDWVIRGLLPSRQVEDALFSLPVGQLSNVVQTDFGYHVIEVLASNPAQALEEDQMNELRQQRLLDWLKSQRRKATIVVYVADLQDITTTE